jgi:hypothetical protein
MFMACVCFGHSLNGSYPPGVKMRLKAVAKFVFISCTEQLVNGHLLGYPPMDNLTITIKSQSSAT